jgi:hypothetical protein
MSSVIANLKAISSSVRKYMIEHLYLYKSHKEVSHVIVDHYRISINIDENMVTLATKVAINVRRSMLIFM